MTRINAYIKPKELSREHLLAEHREIKRIPNCIYKGRYSLKNIPEQFTLGEGHVKFFYKKIKWLYRRYKQIHKRCIEKGYDVEDYSEAFLRLKWIAPNKKGEYFWGDWKPDKKEIERIREIIFERIEYNNKISKTKRDEKKNQKRSI
jgi:hypothetical protein